MSVGGTETARFRELAPWSDVSVAGGERRGSGLGGWGVEKPLRYGSVWGRYGVTGGWRFGGGHGTLDGGVAGGGILGAEKSDGWISGRGMDTRRE